MMEQAETSTKASEDSAAKDSSSEEEVSLCNSTLTLTSLVPDSPPVRRSQPIAITSNRKKEGEFLSSSVSPIPNPFPELCSLPHSSLLNLSLQSESSDKSVVQVHGEDGSTRSLSVSRHATAREVCNLLVQLAHCSDQENWALLECYPTLGLERCLEDHEIVLDVQAAWSVDVEARFHFSKNYAKYEFFNKQTTFFPESMISDSTDTKKKMTSQDFIQNLITSRTTPQIQGFLHLKETSKKSWKKGFFVLRRSGLYKTIKGFEKDPRHLHYTADLDVSNVYTVIGGSKLYGSPTDFTFCIKPTWDQGAVKDLKIMCAETEKIRTLWISAIRLFKYGKLLQHNFKFPKSSPPIPDGSRLADRKSKSEESLVAMDFSGKAGGRVIDNPTEAESAEQEEGQAWRKREALRCCLSNMSSEPCTSNVHKTHPWFHGGLSRGQSEKLIEKQGLVDGMFLVRRSQMHENCFVLSLCYEQKVRHYIVTPIWEEGKHYFSIDHGKTIFIDILQLVEFYQINKGDLPVRLKYPCICVSL
ncbi:growth factor receptor-bound protein 7 [Fundulus heteroclitus]|uniref:Growth factor receptor bound protein 7 n=1 Tax=Fundulus heteroclitus TaxID=8078 RepID=A0A3Q2UA52_FUNHE|nr:growth factor receptor-bound protein 7 [Fundulus heteroclitus]XP_021172212.1 growth factor receptor-bound protein 7 [Fundulus heteroclitus]